MQRVKAVFLGATRDRREAPSRIATSLVMALALVVVSASPALADRAPGTWVLDGSVRTIVPAPGGGAIVGGGFSGVRDLTGGGLIVASEGAGAVNAAAFPHVAGIVQDAASDGRGGWYIGGSFTHVGGVQRGGLAHVNADGSVDPVWNPAPSGGSGQQVSAVEVSGTTVFVGGGFTQVGGQARSGLAALDATSGAATTWNPAPDSSVDCIVLSGVTLYIGGDFSRIAGQDRTGLAAVDVASGDLTAWNPVVTQSGGVGLTDIAVSGSTVYVSGSFSELGGEARSGVGAVDAATGAPKPWSPSPDGEVYGLAATADAVYIAGEFSTIDGVARTSVAALDPESGAVSTWSPAVSGYVYRVAAIGSTVYIAGEFFEVQGQRRDNAAALSPGTGDIKEWNPAPGGPVRSLTVSNTAAVIGGPFTGAGAVTPTGGLVKVRADGTLDTSWAPGASLDPGAEITALAVEGRTVYVGGGFHRIGNQDRSGLAAVDALTGTTTSWNPRLENPGAPTRADALSVSAGTVYVGGEFAAAGGQPRAGAAALSTTTGQATAWNPAPAGRISGLAASGATVYVGGAFTRIGGQDRNALAALDGTTGNATSWDPAPSGPTVPGPLVSSLTLASGTVYVGGTFTAIGAQQRRGLAALDPATGAATAWNPSPDGLGPFTVAASGSTVYAGGFFRRIGGQPRNGLAALDATTGNSTVWDPAIDDHSNLGAGALAISGEQLFAGGSFIAAGGKVVGPLAVLRGGHGSPPILDPGTSLPAPDLPAGGSPAPPTNPGESPAAPGSSPAPPSPATTAPKPPAKAPTSIARAASVLGLPVSAVKRVGVLPRGGGVLYAAKRPAARKIPRVTPTLRLPVVAVTTKTVRLGYRITVSGKGRRVTAAIGPSTITAGARRLTISIPKKFRRALARGTTLRLEPTIGRTVGQAMTFKVGT